MRKQLILTSLFLVLAILVAMLPTVSARPEAQFAGCDFEDKLDAGTFLYARGLLDVNLEVVVLGVGDFDPAVAIRNAADGEILVCNDDGRDTDVVSVDLPSVTTEPSEKNAKASLRVPNDERLDLEIIVTSADGLPGEFVVMISGTSVFPATDKDIYGLKTSEAMVEAEVPMGIYVANLGLPRNPLNPEVTFKFGETFEETCSASSSASLCAGDSEDLTGYSVTLEEDTPIELIGNDVMLYYQAGGEPSEFVIEVNSANGASTGPYYLIVHTGLGEAPAAE